MELVTIIGAIIGLVIGTALVRYLRRTWWGRHLFAAGDWRDDDVNRRSKDDEIDHWKNYEQEMIKQDMCYGNMGLGLGPKKPDDN